MSYCRFSSDNWKSDVYVYASVHGGYQCHVAHAKHIHPEGKECPPMDWTTAESLGETYDAQRKWLDESVLAPHTMQEVEDFVTETAKGMAEALLAIRCMGYHVPQGAIDALNEEDEEEEP